MGVLSFLGKNKRRAFCSAVIVAAGSSRRMAGEDKLTARLSGEKLIVHTLRAFDMCGEIDEIILVTRADRLQEMSDIAAAAGVKKLTLVVPGGDSRLESSFAGVCAVSKKAGLIAIHDGARPLVTGEMISAAVRKAAEVGAAIPVVPVNDTLKTVAGGVVTGSVDRDSAFRVQTPQVFDSDLIKAALTKVLQAGETVTDDSSAVQSMGGSVGTVAGSEENIKITTPADLVFAQAVLDRRNGDADRSRI